MKRSVITIKRNFFIDFDSTIVDSVAGFCDLYTDKFWWHDDYKIPNHLNVNSWNLEDECPLAIKYVEEMFGDERFFDKLKFFPNAKDVLLKLNDRFNLIVCSIGTYDNLVHKADWLNKNLPFMDAILIRNKGVKMDKSSVNMSKSFFLDDHADNLNSSNALLRYCYGVTKEWNKGWKSDRLVDWLEVEKVFLNNYKGN